MRITRMLKRTQIATVVMLLTMGQVFAASSDAITPPSVTANQPFLLDSGIWDFTSSDYNNSYGFAWPVTNSNRHCPANFVPFLKMTPYKSLVTEDVQQSTPGQVYACSFPYPDPSYQGNYVFDGGDGRYKANVFFSSLTSGKGNVGVKWSVYCYPAGSALPADDNACNNLPAAQPVYSQTYSFQSISVVNSYTTYGYNVAQSYTSSVPQMIPWLGNGQAGPGNVYLLVPYSGTYQLTLKVNLIDTGDTATCIAFYYQNTNTSERNPFSSISNRSEVRIYVPGSDHPRVGNTATTLQYTGVHFNAGERFYIEGINWAGSCGCADISRCHVFLTSDGFLTITRTGP